eukprot:TRINITY_DN990_c0_g2_i3.p1 TRINITY_DN990_c0_g2~~TRINITY_DN990_c0_g2_i3.p1  ORF type:complete len:919 (-),score=198.87 TRINITY_DN990_c0_g2_i3:1342-4098(-)
MIHGLAEFVPPEAGDSQRSKPRQPPPTPSHTPDGFAADVDDTPVPASGAAKGRTLDDIGRELFGNQPMGGLPLDGPRNSLISTASLDVGLGQRPGSFRSSRSDPEQRQLSGSNDGDDEGGGEMDFRTGDREGGSNVDGLDDIPSRKAEPQAEGLGGGFSFHPRSWGRPWSSKGRQEGPGGGDGGSANLSPPNPVSFGQLDKQQYGLKERDNKRNASPLIGRGGGGGSLVRGGSLPVFFDLQAALAEPANDAGPPGDVQEVADVKQSRRGGGLMRLVGARKEARESSSSTSPSGGNNSTIGKESGKAELTLSPSSSVTGLDTEGEDGAGELSSFEENSDLSDNSGPYQPSGVGRGVLPGVSPQGLPKKKPSRKSLLQGSNSFGRTQPVGGKLGLARPPLPGGKKSPADISPEVTQPIRHSRSKSQVPEKEKEDRKEKEKAQQQAAVAPGSTLVSTKLGRGGSVPKDMKLLKFDELNMKAKHTQFQLAELKMATDNFSDMNVLGQGGFGKVYRGVLPVDNKEVAIKVLKKGSSQGDAEFITELELLSRLSHKNLVKLLGFCCTSKQRVLVYQYVPNGSLYDHLHGKLKEVNGPLSWDARLKLAVGTAKGLKYLHTQLPQILHRDVKASNILVSKQFEAKVADLGCARMLKMADPTCERRVGAAGDSRLVDFVSVGMGTVGHMAPEVLMSGEISAASDAFSFGVVLLELLSGREPLDRSQPRNLQSLVSWALPLVLEQKWDEVLDPFLLSSMGPSSPGLLQLGRLVEACLQFDPLMRPPLVLVTAYLVAVAQGKDEGSLPELPHRPVAAPLNLSASPHSTVNTPGSSVDYDSEMSPDDPLSGRGARDTFGGATEGESGGDAVPPSPSSVPRTPEEYQRAMQAMMSLIEEGTGDIEWAGELAKVKASPPPTMPTSPANMPGH